MSKTKTQSQTLIGKQLPLKAGTKVRTQGVIETQQRDTVITVRSVERARNNKTRITWKRDGYAATTLV
jgi:hypothetical protein